MKFKGDIIITDPCYIIKKTFDTTKPSIEDYPILKGKRSKPFKDYTEEENKAYKEFEIAEKELENKNPDNWELCEYGSKMEKLGINNYLTRDTEYGDWSCVTINTDTGEVIGEFCADAGLVSVFLLEEVLKYNPDFDYHLLRQHTTTIIKDFNGEVEIVYDEEKESVYVIGKGNINFKTKQCGF